MNLGLDSRGLWAGFAGVRNRSRRTWGQVFMNLESAPHGLGIEFTWTWGRVRRDSGWLSYGLLVTFSECPDGCRTNSWWQLQWTRENLVPGFARCLLFRRRIRSILLPPPTNPWKNPAALRGFFTSSRRLPARRRRSIRPDPSRRKRRCRSAPALAGLRFPG